MKYSAQVADHIDATNLVDWNVVHSQVGDAYSDPRYLRVVESTLGHCAPCRPVIFYNGSGAPVGLTTMSACSLDVAQMAPPWARRVVGWIRRVWPAYLQLKTVMCGPAATILQEKLYTLPGVDRQKILLALDEQLCEFARQQRASVILMGDFDASDRSWLDALLSLGFVVGDSHPSYCLELPFTTFDEYLACMRSEPRRQITRNRKKLFKASATVQHYSGRAHATAFTKQHHAFYLELLERVENSMVTLPLDFFQEMVEHFTDIVHLVDIRIDGEPVAFSIGLNWKGRYEMLFVGYDQSLNDEYSLYFNTFFEVIDWALQAGCTTLELGATCDFFKARLGAKARSRTLYVKAPGLLRYPLRWFSGLVLPPHELPEPRTIFIREPTKAEA